MNVGSMNEKFELEQSVKTRTSSGSYENTWQSLGVRWCEKVDEKAGELVIADKVTMEVNIRLKVRYSALYRSSMRVKYRDEYYMIVGISEIDRRRFQEISIKKQ